MAIVDPLSPYLVLFDSLALIIPRHALLRSFSEHAILKTLKSHSFAVRPANLSLFYGVLNVVRFSPTPRDARISWYINNVILGLILVLVYDRSPRRSPLSRFCENKLMFQTQLMLVSILSSRYSQFFN